MAKTLHNTFADSLAQELADYAAGASVSNNPRGTRITISVPPPDPITGQLILQDITDADPLSVAQTLERRGPKVFRKKKGVKDGKKRTLILGEIRADSPQTKPQTSQSTADTMHFADDTSSTGSLWVPGSPEVIQSSHPHPGLFPIDPSQIANVQGDLPFDPNDPFFPEKMSDPRFQHIVDRVLRSENPGIVIKKVDPYKEYEKYIKSLPLEERCMASFAEFFREGWHVTDPTTPLVWNWHLEVICAHLQAMIEDWIKVQQTRLRNQDQQDLSLILPDFEQRIQNIIINVPPGSSKSRITSVYLPAWTWLWWPSFRWTFISANPAVAIRDSVFCRQLMRSEWYQNTFRPTWTFSKEQDAKTSFNNTAGGSRQAKGAGAAITGDRGDALVGDDLNDIAAINSDVERLNVNDWWDTAAANRLSDLNTSLRILIQQRIHEDDHTGHILPSGMYHHLVIKQEWEPDTRCECYTCKNNVQPLGDMVRKDPRKEAGEVLDPVRTPRKILQAEQERLGERMYAAQHQQTPSPAGGSIFKAEWWNYWKPAHYDGMPLPRVLERIQVPSNAHPSGFANQTMEMPIVELPEEFDEIAMSWDMTFKDALTSDFICGGIYGRKGVDIFILDLYHRKGDINKALAAIRAMSLKWPQALLKLVEDKANGPAVIDLLKSEIPGLVAVNPEGNKQGRANAVSPLCESRHFYLPHPNLYSWVKKMRNELEGYPATKHDDIVDQFTQMLKRWFDRDKIKFAIVQPSITSIPEEIMALDPSLRGLANSADPAQQLRSAGILVPGGYTSTGQFIPPRGDAYVYGQSRGPRRYY